MNQDFMAFTPNERSCPLERVPVLMQFVPSIQVQIVFGGESTTLF